MLSWPSRSTGAIHVVGLVEDLKSIEFMCHTSGNMDWFERSNIIWKGFNYQRHKKMRFSFLRLKRFQKVYYILPLRWSCDKFWQPLEYLQCTVNHYWICNKIFCSLLPHWGEVFSLNTRKTIWNYDFSIWDSGQF